MKAIITVGISASGKSTHADELVKEGWCKVERDVIRRDIFKFKQWDKYKFTRAKEEQVSDAVEGMIAGAARTGVNIIISDTNLNKKYREGLVTYLDLLGYEVEIMNFPISLKEAWKRDQSREYSVGRDVIYKQYKQFNKYIGRKTYTPDLTKPAVILCDIDGTIAQMKGRSPFEWSRVGEDRLRVEISQMVEGMANQTGAEIIMLSGRDGCCRKETLDWLDHYYVEYSGLYMRPKGDNRPDTEIKEELFWKHIADNYNVIAVVDDRPQVVRMWIELGIPNVISVGDPWLEF